MSGRVDLDLRGHVGIVGRLSKHILGFRVLRIVVLGDRDEQLRLYLRKQQMRAVRTFSNEATTVVGAGCANAIRKRCRTPNREGTTHAVAHRADPAARVDLVPRIQPFDEGARIRDLRLWAQRPSVRQHIRDRRVRTRLRRRCRHQAVERIRDEHAIADLGQALTHLALRRT